MLRLPLDTLLGNHVGGGQNTLPAHGFQITLETSEGWTD